MSNAYDTEFWGKVDVREEWECWPYQGAIDGDGYGVFHRTIKAHRLSYMLTYGEIPEGMHVHHDCESRSCCNPKHLRALTIGQHSILHHERKYNELVSRVETADNLEAQRRAQALAVTTNGGRPTGVPPGSPAAQWPRQ
jgi:HNH endonuclease